MKTTVKFRLAVSPVAYGTATFSSGAAAYDWIRFAIETGSIDCLSTVSGPGAADYMARAVERVRAHEAAAARYK